jgi:exodeoxyribonuclease-3
MKKILSWNVNGLRAAEKKGFREWLCSENPDILCIQEVKAFEGQLSDGIKYIEGYKSYFSCAERKGYSGVAIYSKEEPRSVGNGFGIEEFDIEGRALIAEYDDFMLLNIYFPNGKASKERLEFKLKFYEEFLKYVVGLKDSGKKLVICGDVNTAHKEIDLARPKENEKTSGFLPEEREWIDRLIKSGFVDTLREFNKDAGSYTWWDLKTRARERNVGWRIDYFFISENLKDKLKSAFIMPEVYGSDHCPIGIELEV